MSITYTWKVTGVKTTTVGTLSGAVVQTYWKKIGTDENGNTGEFTGATPFKVSPDQQSFIQFDQLTEEVVLSWIQPMVVGDYEQHVNAQIAKQIAEKVTPVADADLPWAPPPSAPTPAP